jgi:two-component system capsular synthesis response regulator RcsB
VRVALNAADRAPHPRASALSAREWEVFQLYAQGLAVHEIAERLQRSGKTISTQKRSGMRKLGLETEDDLVDYARQIGVI